MRYLFVVIKYCVHVLDPDSINWPIKDQPFSIWSLGVGKCSVAHSQYSVRPLVRYWIKRTIQLAHGD